MTTFTKDRLEEIAEDGFLKHGESKELARIALASLEAEPVAWTTGDYSENVLPSMKDREDGEAPCIITRYWDKKSFSNHAKDEEQSKVWLKEAIKNTGARPLYTAPPSAVSVPECFKSLLHHAYGMTMGHDWNKGTMAGHHRAKLCQAVDECRAAMLQGADGTLTNEGTIPANTPWKLRDAVEIIRSSGIEIDAEKIFAERDALNTPDCWCRTCRPATISDMRFVVCPECGNKRCPHANDHSNACTGSNEPGQEGSAYPAAPRQE